MRPEAKYIYFNGEFVPWDDAKIHILSHVVQYGSGVFEGIRAYKTKEGTAIFRPKDHFKRFKDSMRIYRMEIKETISDLINISKELIKKNKLDSAYIRPFAYRGFGEIGVNPIKLKTELSIAAFYMGTYLLQNPENGIDAMVSSWRRPAPDTIPPLAKASGNYLSSQLGTMEAGLYGFKEAIMLDFNGFVSEGPGENIFLVKNGELYTPPVGASILRGITKDSVMKIAKHIGIPVYEKFIPRAMLYTADELFFCGTAAEITPIGSVDKIYIKDGKIGPITKKIRDEFLSITSGEKDPFDWLDYVE